MVSQGQNRKIPLEFSRNKFEVRLESDTSVKDGISGSVKFRVLFHSLNLRRMETYHVETMRKV